jgi:hypothetical protein
LHSDVAAVIFPPGHGRLHRSPGRADADGRRTDRLGRGEPANWTHGAWRHSWFNGVFGWWWFSNNQWYLYAEPIYPYPGYFPGAIEQPAYASPDDQEPNSEQAAAGPPAAYYYYCANPSGYYPDLSECPSGWQVVPAGANEPVPPSP